MNFNCTLFYKYIYTHSNCQIQMDVDMSQFGCADWYIFSNISFVAILHISFHFKCRLNKDDFI